jgi:hypothetical protein
VYDTHDADPAIGIPRQILVYVSDQEYIPKYLKMIDNGGLRELIALAEQIGADAKLNTLTKKRRRFWSNAANKVWAGWVERCRAEGLCDDYEDWLETKEIIEDLERQRQEQDAPPF